jgi:hypothetical protein
MAVAQGKHRPLDSRTAVAHRLLSELPCQIRLEGGHPEAWSGFRWSGPGASPVWTAARSASVTRRWYGS